MMTKTLVWTQFAMEEGRAPEPPEFYVNAGDKLELYVAREESEEKQMIYAIHNDTKRHFVIDEETHDWDGPMGEYRSVEATPDGWIEWEGGDCPLPDRDMVEVRMRDGGKMTGCQSTSCWLWGCYGERNDIIAYRPILEKQATLAGAKLWQDAEGTIPCREGDPVGRVGEPPAWDGESWPIPIGTECLFDTPDEYGMTSTWMNAKVVGRDGPACVVAVDGDGYHGSALRSDFRPIRSEEDRAVEEIMRVTSSVKPIEKDIAERHARAIYRAGYRKTGGE